MVDSIGSTPPDPQIYKKDLGRAVNLFQKSLSGYEQSTEPHQKEKFKDVMDKCLVVIHESLKEILKKEAQKPLNKVDQDYQNFIANGNPNTLDQLNKDLDTLKNT
jgi:Sec-independent protein translocase protein TatA